MHLVVVNLVEADNELLLDVAGHGEKRVKDTWQYALLLTRAQPQLALVVLRASTFLSFLVLLPANNGMSFASTGLTVCKNCGACAHCHEVFHDELGLAQIKCGVLGAAFWQDLIELE